MKKAGNIVLAIIPPVLILLAWWYVTNFTDTPNAILPKISSVKDALISTVESGQLQSDLGASLLCVLKGYAIAVVVGGILGSLMGMFTTVKKILQPTVTCFRQIPMIAWMPLIILWFGIGDAAKIVLIVIASFFPILVNTQSGIETTPEGLIEVANLYRLNPVKKFVKVYLPHALPNILVGLKLGLSVSWMAVVGAELIASTTGIGYRMSNARSMMQSNILILCMLVVGLIGVLMDKILGFVFKKLTPWEKVKKA